MTQIKSGMGLFCFIHLGYKIYLRGSSEIQIFNGFSMEFHRLLDAMETF